MTATVHSNQAQPWRQAIPALILLLGWTLFLYRDTGIAMVTIWARSETFTHAFLVPPIVLWLVWRRRQIIATQTPQPSLGTAVFIACVSFAWLLGDLVAINAVTQLALVALLVLLVPAVLGWAVARLIIFPLCFLFFAVPIGEFVMPQLMEWTANFTVFALRLSGIPVYREGLQFVIPSGSWSVVEACSGVRYLIASLTVGTLFAYLNYQSTKRRILFVIVSILVPIVANWLRAYMIVLLGHVSGNKLATGVDHLIYGWVFFGVVIMLMFIIGARWAEPEPPPGERAAALRAPTQTVTATRLWGGAVCLAALVAWPQITLWGIHRSEGAGTVTLTAPNALATSWQRVPAVEPGFKPVFHNPSAEINSSYASQGRSVGLYLGYYREQNYDHKLVSSSNVLVGSKDPYWSHVASGTQQLVLGGKRVAMRTAELGGTALTGPVDSRRLLAWQIYWINGALTGSDSLAKIYSAFYRLTGRGDDSVVIVVYTAKDDQAGADALLASFLSTNYATINELLLNARHNK